LADQNNGRKRQNEDIIFFSPKKWKELFFNKFVFSKKSDGQTPKKLTEEGFPQDFARAQSFLNTAVEQRHPGALGLLGPLDVISGSLSRVFFELKIPGGLKFRESSI